MTDREIGDLSDRVAATRTVRIKDDDVPLIFCSNVRPHPRRNLSQRKLPRESSAPRCCAASSSRSRRRWRRCAASAPATSNPSTRRSQQWGTTRVSQRPRCRSLLLEPARRRVQSLPALRQLRSPHRCHRNLRGASLETWPLRRVSQHRPHQASLRMDQALRRRSISCVLQDQPRLPFLAPLRSPRRPQRRCLRLPRSRRSRWRGRAMGRETAAALACL